MCRIKISTRSKEQALKIYNYNKLYSSSKNLLKILIKSNKQTLNFNNYDDLLNNRLYLYSASHILLKIKKNKILL